MEPRDRLPDEDILHLTSLEEVFGGFAHEIAQPLHTIMIASQVLQLKLARTDLADAEKEFLTQVRPLLEKCMYETYIYENRD